MHSCFETRIYTHLKLVLQLSSYIVHVEYMDYVWLSEALHLGSTAVTTVIVATAATLIDTSRLSMRIMRRDSRLIRSGTCTLSPLRISGYTRIHKFLSRLVWPCASKYYSRRPLEYLWWHVVQ
jgi:hypothetical protein